MSDEETVNATDALELDLTSRPVWMICIARAGSGKSVLLRSVMKSAAQQGVYKHIICFTQTGTCLNDEYDWLPEHAVREVTDVEQIFAIFTKLKQWKKRNKKIHPVLEFGAGRRSRRGVQQVGVRPTLAAHRPLLSAFSNAFS